MNLYAYVKNNAINSIDPTGMFEAKLTAKNQALQNEFYDSFLAQDTRDIRYYYIPGSGQDSVGSAFGKVDVLEINPIARSTEILGLGASGGKVSMPSSMGKNSTSFSYGSKNTRNSATQISPNLTSNQAMRNLQDNGYNKSVSKDGSVTVLTNNEGTYRFYGSSTSGNVPSASYTPKDAKKPAAKLRFKD